MPKRYLAILILFFLVQLALRTTHIDRQWVFIDEGLHINRSISFHQGDPYPALQSYEKLFLYVLLGIFDLTQPGTVLPLARIVVAVFSLLDTAAIFSVINYFTHRRYALLGVLFYVLVPHAVFYERLTLTDPIAGALGAVLIWQSIRAAAKPSHRNTILLGIVMFLTVAAKLNMLFALSFPTLAVLFCGKYVSLRDAYNRYASTLIFSGMIFIILSLLLIFIPLTIYQHTLSADERLPKRTASLVNEDYSIQFLRARAELLWTNFQLLASPAIAYFSVIAVVFGLIRKPRVVLFLLACLFFASLPHLIFIAHLWTRYQVSSLPMLTILVVTSLGLLHHEGRLFSVWGFCLGLLALLVWAVAFALPFDRTIINDPPQSPIPSQDSWEYFRGPYNAYGSWEAIAHAERISQQAETLVVVLPLNSMCPFMPYYRWEQIEVKCLAKPFQVSAATINWEPTALELLEAGATVYVTTDGRDRVPPEDSRVEWTMVEEFFKPARLRKVVLWQLSLLG